MKKSLDTSVLDPTSGSIKLRTDGPKLTAGLNTAPEISPTEKAPAVTVNPIASPKYWFPSNFLFKATFKITNTNKNVKRISATIN